MYRIGDVLVINEKEKVLVNGVDKEVYSMFVLNGLYEFKVNKKSLEMTLLKKPTQRESMPNVEFFLNGYNLYYDLEDNNFIKIETATCLGNVNLDKELDKEIKEDFFHILEGNLINGSVIQGYKKMAEMINFSRSYDIFANVLKNTSPLEYKKGDLFTDNIQKSDFYHNEISRDNKVLVNKDELKGNYWRVLRESDIGFLAINLETMLIFHFNENGKATHYVNDIDSRWTYPLGNYGMITNSLEHYMNYPFSFQQNFKKQSQEFYKLVEITEDHFFYGLYVSKNVKLGQRGLELIQNSILRGIKAAELKYVSPRSWCYRERFGMLMSKLSKRIKDNGVSFYHNNFGFYDDNLEFSVYKNPSYDRFAYDSFYEKSLDMYNELGKNEDILGLGGGVLTINGIEYLEGYDLLVEYNNYKEVHKKMFNIMKNNTFSKGHWINKYSKELVEEVVDAALKKYPYDRNKIEEDLEIV